MVTMDALNTELAFSFARFAEGFDEHIRRSIRGYVDLLSDCVGLSEYFVEDGTIVFDIGCSTGTFLYEILRKNRDRCPATRYIGIDIEDNFSKYWPDSRSDLVSLLVADARTFQIPENCSFVTSIFSLQFISPRERQTLINNIYRSLIPGGALIIAEKTLSGLSRLNDMLTSIYYEFKRQSFTEEEILAKERSLRSIMKLWTEEQILNSLQAAGFARANVQCFWRNHNFAAFIALKNVTGVAP
jgi:tRNA (cmo5U34)-methyltransferase